MTEPTTLAELFVSLSESFEASKLDLKRFCRGVHRAAQSEPLIRCLANHCGTYDAKPVNAAESSLPIKTDSEDFILTKPR